MSPEQQRIKIAEACGWTDCNWYEDNAGPGFWNGYPPTVIGVDKSGDWQAVKAQHHKPLPNYTASLDAMAEAEKVLTDEEWVDYCAELVNRAPTFPQYGLGSGTDKARRLASATAARKAEAFLRAKSPWQDQPRPE